VCLPDGRSCLSEVAEGAPSARTVTVSRSYRDTPRGCCASATGLIHFEPTTVLAYLPTIRITLRYFTFQVPRLHSIVA
jgi:hypothetical protein